MFVQTREELLKSLREAKPELARRYGLVNIYIFGSFSKDNADLSSDVDLLIDIQEPKFDSLAGIKIYLEDKLGRSVDLVRNRPGLRKSFIERIQKDMIHV
ncbi:toxin-antitoxin system toxin subunit [Leptospira langatensis]|uniref:Toxin-antitoxin system toxin subunit n=1 Tax=Leptospira langatensis TaxID=2484983 RepID=A0A5F1ZTK0_9LEPT|nr:nucleotidyltransferase domain-containing protein [Leptospira langatensis]TGK03008.1 toxin-antitoxin system toxin subunit [Leptospira langatensis]TGL41764.1 toxin-antitoxin system toxin subunit [Leptospira langatensis]